MLKMLNLFYNIKNMQVPIYIKVKYLNLTLVS